ncbi:MAG: hypothetical protein OXL41_11195 [Nitrospinae bacterium]|nr:hypothetical protein [Nitrospinota bacterium]
MKIRTLLILAVPVAAAVYFLHYNREIIDLRLTDAWSVRVPLALVVIGAALVGSFLASVLGWGEAALSWFTRKKMAKKQKRLHRAQERFARAQSFGIQGKKRRARRELKRSLKDDPSFVPALRLAADLAIDSGNPNDAVQWNERLRAVTNNSPDAIIRLSETLDHSGQAKKALELLAQNSRGRGASPLVLRKLRDMYLENGRLEAAIEICEKLSQSGGSDLVRKEDNQTAGRAYLTVGETKLNNSDPEAAISFLEQAQRYLTKEKKAYLLLGDAQLAAGRERRALRTWENGYQELGGLEFLQRLALAVGPLESQNAIKKAAANIYSAGKRREKDIHHHVLHAALMLEAGQIEKVDKSLEQASAMAVSIESQDSWVRLALHLIEARCLQEKGERLAAENEFKKTAQEASRILLGKSISGTELKPF